MPKDSPQTRKGTFKLQCSWYSTNLSSDWVVFIAFALPRKPLSSISSIFMQNLAHMILFDTGTLGTKGRLIDVKKVASWRFFFVTFCLHYMHSQGGDTTSAFVKKSKTTPLLVSPVSLMFSVSWKIFWNAKPRGACASYEFVKDSPKDRERYF